MDNATHAFVGLAVGELIDRVLPKEEDPNKASTRRFLLLFLCAAASNFPDLDLVLYPLLKAPLGYLLHHRGHSHTFVWEVPQAMLLLCGTFLFWPRARKIFLADKITRFGALFAVAIGFVLHISMDFLNSYGIHPFFPFDTRWYYGDMVFIIEPIFWATMGIAVVMTFKSKILRVFWALFLLGIPVAATIKGFLPWPSLALLMSAAGVIIAVQTRSKERSVTALATAMALSIAFIISQGIFSSEARDEIKYALEKKDQGFKVLDTALNSFPSNPFCWSFTSIALDDHLGTYRLRSGVYSLNVALVPVSKCSEALLRNKIPEGSAPDIAYLRENDGNWSELKNLNTANCHFRAWMRFARMPLATSQSANDLRFINASARGNFSELRFDDFKNEACPDHVPPWTPPREDLLREPIALNGH